MNGREFRWLRLMRDLEHEEAKVQGACSPAYQLLLKAQRQLIRIQLVSERLVKVGEDASHLVPVIKELEDLVRKLANE